MDTLRLEGGGRVIDLYPWLSAKAQGVQALAGIVGFGLPGVENQWFDNGPAGYNWKQSRVPRRTISLPLRVYAANRADLNALLSDLAVALDPFTPQATSGDRNGVARLFFADPEGYEWFVDVVRTGGGDWARKKDSDDRTYFKTTLELEAGDPFWTRAIPEEFTVWQEAPASTPLLPRMAKLRVQNSITSAEAYRTVYNTGDLPAWLIFTAEGPLDGFDLYGSEVFEPGFIWPDGYIPEFVAWGSGDPLLEGETLTVNMREHTIEDQSGANRYPDLWQPPRFFSIPPGESQIGVQMWGTTLASRLRAQYWPRRWAVV